MIGHILLQVMITYFLQVTKPLIVIHPDINGLSSAVVLMVRVMVIVVHTGFVTGLLIQIDPAFYNAFRKGRYTGKTQPPGIGKKAILVAEEFYLLGRDTPGIGPELP